MDRITDQQWQQYEDEGYLVLGRVASDQQLAALQQRVDDLMLNKAPAISDRLTMELDSESGTYDEQRRSGRGNQGATLGYRKIENLEHDPLFLAYMQHPLFRHICARVYGQDAAITCYRAMFMNKPAHKGTFLPWHQDRWNFLDRDPLLTIYTALDPATKENGCVQIVPKSHKLGIINPDHPWGFMTKEQAAEYCPPEKAKYLELKAGEVALLHNWLMHGSDVNRSDISRRAFSVCCMDGRTQTTHESQREQGFSTIFGEGALDPATVTAAAA